MDRRHRLEPRPVPGDRVPVVQRPGQSRVGGPLEDLLPGQARLHPGLEDEGVVAVGRHRIVHHLAVEVLHLVLDDVEMRGPVHHRADPSGEGTEELPVLMDDRGLDGEVGVEDQAHPFGGRGTEESLHNDPPHGVREVGRAHGHTGAHATIAQISDGSHLLP